MAYVIANTATKNQRIYAFNSVAEGEKIEWELVEILTTEYDYDQSIFLTSATLDEISTKGVAVFHSKKSAKAAYNKLGIGSCRYVELVLNITHEYKSRNFKASSSWTALNDDKITL